MNGIFVILLLIFSIFVGIYAGLFAVKLNQKRNDALLLKGVYDMLDGKRKNQIDLDGRLIDVKRFKVRDDNDNEIVIDLYKDTPKNQILNNNLNSNKKISIKEKIIGLFVKNK